MQDHGSFQNHLHGLLLEGYESASSPLGHAFWSPGRSVSNVTDPYQPGEAGLWDSHSPRRSGLPRTADTHEVGRGRARGEPGSLVPGSELT